ncbi:MAG: Dabb family protein [Acidobacteria bacterium]|nr:Dabb family protein [Acidobacteriota bacterium]
MRILLRRVWLVALAGLLFASGWVVGQQRPTTQRTVIHAVAWTAQKDATPEGLEDFRRATETLLDTMPGLRRAWVGKLRQPLVVGDLRRDYGLILEFENLATKEAYSSHPNRAPWAAVWEKVRIPGSTNFDVIGE